MRKIILLFGVALLCGCEGQKTSVGVSQGGVIPFDFVTHFEYQNHQYIKFRTSSYDAAVGGVVHDPDCKYCNKK